MDSVDDQNRAWRDADHHEYLKQNKVDPYSRCMAEIQKEAASINLYGDEVISTVRVEDVAKILRRYL